MNRLVLIVYWRASLMHCLHAHTHTHTFMSTHTHSPSLSLFLSHAHTLQDTSKIKLSPSKMSKEMSTRSDDPPTSSSDTTSKPSTQTNGSMFGTGSLPQVTSNTSLRNGYNETVIKTEPESGGSTPACVRSPPLINNTTPGSKVPPSSLSFAPASSMGLSSSSGNGRFGRSFSTPEPKRKCCGSNNNRSSMNDLFGAGATDEMEEDDLKLKPYVFLNNVIKTPPIKPLEEGDDPPITPSPTSVGPPPNRRSTSNPPTNNSCTSNHSNSNHSNPPSTPTSLAPAVGGSSGSNGVGSHTSMSSSQMAKDLNDFYRVMEEVYEKEGRLSSTAGTTASGISTVAGATSTKIDMYNSMSPPGMVRGMNGGVGSSAHLMSPPPYNPTSATNRGTNRLPQTVPPGTSGYAGGNQHLHAALMSSPPHASSPPFTTAGTHNLYTLGQQQQHTPASSLTLQQGSQYPSTVGRVPMTSTHQVDMSLQYSSDHALHNHPQYVNNNSNTPQTTTQQQQVPGKPLEALPQQSMHLSHLNQQSPQLGAGNVAPGNNGTGCGQPGGSLALQPKVYYNGSQQVQRMHASATPLPQQQPPLTPTAPLEHYTAAFQSTPQTSQISPTDPSRSSNPLHHQSLSIGVGRGGPTSYPYGAEPSHIIVSNHIQNHYLPQTLATHPQHHHHQVMPHHQQQSGAALTVSTNSWGGQRQMPRLAYKDTIMAAQHASAVLGRNITNSLPIRMQGISANGTPLSSYPATHIRMGHPSSLQHHTAAPPAYLQTCGSNSHPNSASVAFSRLPFPPNMH